LGLSAASRLVLSYFELNLTSLTIIFYNSLAGDEAKLPMNAHLASTAKNENLIFGFHFPEINRHPIVRPRPQGFL